MMSMAVVNLHIKGMLLEQAVLPSLGISPGRLVSPGSVRLGMSKHQKIERHD